MRVIDFLTLHSDIIGSLPTHCDSINILNKARHILWPMGDWRGTMEYAQLNVACQTNPCVFVPFPIETIKGAWHACKPVPVESCGYLLIKTKDDFCSCCCPEEITLIGNEKQSPIPFEITNSGYLFGFKLINKDFEGKATITITYLDSSTTEHTQEIVFEKAFKTYLLENRAYKITAIYKSAHPIVLTSKDGTKLHRFHSNEIEPKYSQYQVSGCPCTCIVIKGKKIFNLYTLDDLNDPLDLNPHALELIITARRNLKVDDVNSPAIYSAWTKLAREYLEKELEDKYESYFSSGRTNMIPDTDNLVIE